MFWSFFKRKEGNNSDLLNFKKDGRGGVYSNTLQERHGKRILAYRLAYYEWKDAKYHEFLIKEDDCDVIATFSHSIKKTDPDYQSNFIPENILIEAYKHFNKNFAEYGSIKKHTKAYSTVDSL